MGSGRRAARLQEIRRCEQTAARSKFGDLTERSQLSVLPMSLSYPTSMSTKNVPARAPSNCEASCEIAERFLSALWRDVALVRGVGFTFRNGDKGQWFDVASEPGCVLPVGDPSMMADHAVRQSVQERRDAYFCVTPLGRGKGTPTRSRSANGWPAVWVDIDGMTVQDALALLDRQVDAGAVPAPSAIVASGHGVHVWWFLDTPAPASAKGQAMGAVETLRRLLDGDPKATRPNQVMRVPGTINWKDAANPVPVELLSFEPDRRYGLGQLSTLSLEKKEERREVTTVLETQGDSPVLPASESVASMSHDTQSSVVVTQGDSPVLPASESVASMSHDTQSSVVVTQGDSPVLPASEKPQSTTRIRRELADLSILWLSSGPWEPVLRKLGLPDAVVRAALRGKLICSPFRTDRNPSAHLVQADRNGQWVLNDYGSEAHEWVTIQEAYAYACTRKWERFNPKTDAGRKALAHWTGKMVDAWSLWVWDAVMLDATYWWQSDTMLGQVAGHVRSLIIETARRGHNARHIGNEWLRCELRNAGIEVTKAQTGYALRLLVLVGLLDRVAWRSKLGHTTYNYSLRFDAVAEAEERLATLGIDADSPSCWWAVREVQGVSFLPAPAESVPVASAEIPEAVPVEVVPVPVASAEIPGDCDQVAEPERRDRLAAMADKRPTIAVGGGVIRKGPAPPRQVRAGPAPPDRPVEARSPDHLRELLLAGVSVRVPVHGLRRLSMG
jgi:hypothetical protein